MSLADIELTVAQWLAGAGLGLTLGTNLFAGPILDGPAIPDLAVFVRLTGGAAPEPYVAGRELVRLLPELQVITRSAREDQSGARALAGQAFGALLLSPLPGCDVVLSREAAPIYGGPDAEQRPQYFFRLTVGHVASLL